MRASRPTRLAMLIAALLLTTGTNADELDERFDSDVLVIDAATACLRFDIYVAVTREQQMRGLMFVRELPLTTGMLFVYGREGRRSMWMRNTYIPLDIAFASDDGSIINIARDTVPMSEESISSAGPASYVLELNAGVAEALSIEPGSRLLWGPTMGISDAERNGDE
ncbi:MAG: DUF192 domain-containing protein [Woeseiaceae bacterium]|nr:DUF192 domain-containing protein [Woeseiaceae bacterium]